MSEDEDDTLSALAALLSDDDEQEQVHDSLDDEEPVEDAEAVHEEAGEAKNEQAELEVNQIDEKGSTKALGLAKTSSVIERTIVSTSPIGRRTESNFIFG